MDSPIVHFHVGAADPAAAGKFFEEVFNWKIGPGIPGVAATIDTGYPEINDIRVAGGIIQLPEGAPPFISVFVRVADLDGALARAAERGARIVVPRTDRPGSATIAIIQTPFGHTMGVVQL